MRPGWCGGVLVALACVLGSTVARATEQFPSGPNHRGIATIEPYLIFPENRPGNGIYLNNQLVLETPEQTLVHLLPLPQEGRFAYYALDRQGAVTLGVRVAQGDPAPRITEVAPGFYHVTLVLDGAAYKKLYRVASRSIRDLLPTSRTPDGPVAGPAGVVFFHVASNERQEGADGQVSIAFGLRLHLARFDDERTRHLDYTIVNALPQLRMTWLDASRIEVQRADGRTEVLSVAQFQ